MNTAKKQDQKKPRTRQERVPKKQGQKTQVDPGYEHEHIECRLTR